jgi:hypothetical protein
MHRFQGQSKKSLSSLIQPLSMFKELVLKISGVNTLNWLPTAENQMTACSLLEPPNVELADIQKFTNTERLHGYIEFQGASQITHF